MDKILVVDDMEQNTILMSKYLVEAGYDVISANNGASAIRKAKMDQPDLIILDLIMPGISGYDVCKTLRNDESTKYIIILVITALDSKEARTRAFASGADDYMTKSFDKGVLISKIKSLLRVKELSTQLKTQYAQLEERDRIVEYQLKMARLVQRSLIHEVNFKIKNVSIASKYVPALDIGGDVFDIVNIGDDGVGVFIADVSGHGISAALLTSMLKMMFRGLVTNYHDAPEKILYNMNNEFCGIFENGSTDVYACVFYAYIDIKNKRVKFSNAGHALPMFVDAERREVYELSGSGVPLGLLDKTIYESKEAPFNTGDLILFYTDGLMDSLYKDEPEVFIVKLKEFLLDLIGDVASMETLQVLMDLFYNMEDDAKYTNDDVSVILCNM